MCVHTRAFTLLTLAWALFLIQVCCILLYIFASCVRFVYFPCFRAFSLSLSLLLSPSRLSEPFSSHPICLLCVRKHPFKIQSLWGESTGRLNGPRKMPKTRCLRSRFDFPLLPLQSPSCMVYSLISFLPSLRRSWPPSDCFLTDEKWGASRWKAVARIPDEEKELRMIQTGNFLSLWHRGVAWGNNWDCHGNGSA